MSEWNSIDDVLDFAIQGEQDSYMFYQTLADEASGKSHEIFQDFAKEEMGHKKKLEAIKRKGNVRFRARKIADLKITDYLVSLTANPDMDLQQALIVAMKKEKAAFKLYSDLADEVDNDDIRDMFLLLAQEEAKHKLKFETMYDDQFMTEN